MFRSMTSVTLALAAALCLPAARGRRTLRKGGSPIRRTAVATTLAAALLALPLRAIGWNGQGHMTVAYIAYQALTPATKARVKTLLALNPYASAPNEWPKLLATAPAGADPDEITFMIAATWPDQIKSDDSYQSDGPMAATCRRPTGPPPTTRAMMITPVTSTGTSSTRRSQRLAPRCPPSQHQTCRIGSPPFARSSNRPSPIRSNRTT